MSEKIRVLVADDNSHLRSMINEYITTLDIAEIAGEAGDGAEAIEKLRELQPDVMILDLIMPMLDGIGVLERMAGLNIRKPHVIVLSAMGNENIVQEAMKLGADYYMVKPFDMEALSNRIREITRRDPDGMDVHALYEPAKSAARMLDEKIAGVFLAIGIPAHLQGYKFLREAVKMVLEDNDLINSITKKLYPGVAGRFNATASKVDRSIRHAIEVAWTRGCLENLNAIYGYNVYDKNYKPTNGELIALVAEILQVERDD